MMVMNGNNDDDDGCSIVVVVAVVVILGCAVSGVTPLCLLSYKWKLQKGSFIYRKKHMIRIQDKYGDVETGDTVSHWKRKWCTLRQSREVKQ